MLCLPSVQSLRVRVYISFTLLALRDRQPSVEIQRARTRGHAASPTLRTLFIFIYDFFKRSRNMQGFYTNHLWDYMRCVAIRFPAAFYIKRPLIGQLRFPAGLYIKRPLIGQWYLWQSICIYHLSELPKLKRLCQHGRVLQWLCSFTYE